MSITDAARSPHRARPAMRSTSMRGASPVAATARAASLGPASTLAATLGAATARAATLRPVPLPMPMPLPMPGLMKPCCLVAAAPAACCR